MTPYLKYYLVRKDFVCFGALAIDLVTPFKAIRFKHGENYDMTENLLAVKTPPIQAPQTFHDAVQAVAHLQLLYDKATSFLAKHFQTALLQCAPK